MAEIQDRIQTKKYSREFIEHRHGSMNDGEIEALLEWSAERLENTCSVVAWVSQTDDDRLYDVWEVNVIPTSDADE